MSPKSTPHKALTLAALAAVWLAVAQAAIAPMSTAGERTIAYVSNAESREIHVLEISREGQAVVLQRVAVTGRVMPMAVSPDRKYLFASLRSEPYSVISYAIAPDTGLLTAIDTAPLADDMAYISTDRTGRYLLAASYSGHRISVNFINPDGRVQPKPRQVTPTGKNPHAVATDLRNRYLFVTNLGDDQIEQFQFDEGTGAVAPNHPPAVKTAEGAGPRHFVFHPVRLLLFNSNELDGTVSTFHMSPTGTLTLGKSVSAMPPGFSGKPWAADIHITPDGRFLYASERTSSTIAGFRVDADTGELTRIDSYPTGTQPRGFNIDPAGRYLVAAGQLSNSITIHAIDPTAGSLRQVSQLGVGRDPNWVEIIQLTRPGVPAPRPLIVPAQADRPPEKGS